MNEHEAVDVAAATETKQTPGDPFLELAQEVQACIALRAHELFQERGSAHGSDREDWLLAQAEVLVNVPLHVTETNSELIVRAAVPGIGEHDLEVRVEPRAICIAGRRRFAENPPGEVTVYSERCPDRIFRTLNLPTQVDPEVADATLENGLLEVRLLKSASIRKLSVRARAATA